MDAGDAAQGGVHPHRGLIDRGAARLQGRAAPVGEHGRVLLQPAVRLARLPDDPDRVITHVVEVDDRPSRPAAPTQPLPTGDPYLPEYTDLY